MSNHYHLVLETPNANPVAGMAWRRSTYTIRLTRGALANASAIKAIPYQWK